MLKAANVIQLNKPLEKSLRPTRVSRVPHGNSRRVPPVPGYGQRNMYASSGLGGRASGLYQHQNRQPLSRNHRNNLQGAQMNHNININNQQNQGPRQGQAQAQSGSSISFANVQMGQNQISRTMPNNLNTLQRPSASGPPKADPFFGLVPPRT